MSEPYLFDAYRIAVLGCILVILLIGTIAYLVYLVHQETIPPPPIPGPKAPRKAKILLASLPGETSSLGLGCEPSPHPLDMVADGFTAFRDALTPRQELSPESDLRVNDLSINQSAQVRLVNVRETSTGAGAPVFIYRYVRPAEGKRLCALGYELEHVDKRYGTWHLKIDETKWARLPVKH